MKHLEDVSPGYGALGGQVFRRTHRVEVTLGLRHCSTQTDDNSQLMMTTSPGNIINC